MSLARALPGEWRRLKLTLGFPPAFIKDNPVLFMHERRTPGNQKCLVVVDVLQGPPGGMAMRLGVGMASYSPATLRSDLHKRSETLGAWIKGAKLDRFLTYARSVRFYAGQPDPNDSSHWTIRYEIDGRPGTIDGRIDDHFGVTLQVRDGPGKEAIKSALVHSDPPPAGD